MCACMCAHVCCMRVRVHMHLSNVVHVCPCVYKCVRVCVCVCMFVHVCASVHVFAFERGITASRAKYLCFSVAAPQRVLHCQEQDETALLFCCSAATSVAVLQYLL